jgi:3D (Asp-Asp-Asp) domain-containing protein
MDMTKKLIILFTILTLFTPAVNAKEALARVTYYWGDKITSTGKKPICGKTLAADPKAIPYGSIVSIPAMKKQFVVSDTGSALVSKKASKGKTIVVDVFCSSRAKAQWYIKNYPQYMKIKIEKKHD